MADVNGQNSLAMKRQAVAYFRENKVPEQIERLLNDMFKEKPDDIYGYLIACKELLSSRGFPSLQIDVYCTIKGLSKHVTSVNVPYDLVPEPVISKTPDLKAKSPDPGKQAKGQTTDVQLTAVPSETAVKPIKLEIDDLIDRIVMTIAPELTCVDPTDQKSADRILMSLVQEVEQLSRPVSVQESKDTETADDVSGKFSNLSKKSVSKKPSGMLDKKGVKDSGVQLTDMVEDVLNVDYALLGVSMAILQTGATLKACSVVEHLYPLKEDEKLILPIPVMPLLVNGKNAPGKQNLIKEVLIAPTPGLTAEKGLQQLTEIFHRMGTVLSQKISSAAKCVTSEGCYSPSFDKPELMLDYVTEAINGCGYSIGSDVEIILNCSASDIYDKEKQKYEIIVNTFKSVDDVINLYQDFLDRYPGIVGIIDGVRSQDREGWIKMNQRIGEKCFIVGDELYKRNSKLIPTGVTDKLSSGVVVSADQSNTITELMENILHVKDQDGIVFLSQAAVRDIDSIVVDVAVSCGTRFIKLGGPTRLENISLYRRLASIEHQLQEKGKIKQQEAHVLPVINVQEESEEQGENTA